MLLRRLAVFIAFLLATAVAQQQQQQRLASRSDWAGLYSLRASLGIRARQWPAKSDPCAAWVGVFCRGGRVVGLSLAGLRRTRLGSLAPRFAVDGLQNLTALEVFNATGFRLPGEIPTWFGRRLPRSLAVLDLRSAAVNGTLPADLGTSGNMTSLLLSNNSLSGWIPDSLLSLKGLRSLELSNNNLTGELPNVSAIVGDGTGVVFNVSVNSLYGVISDGTVAALQERFGVVDMSSNYFDGELRVEIWNGSDRAVDLSMNCLSGVPNQRSRADCDEFYRRNGPVPSPSPETSPEKKGNSSKHVLIGVLAAVAALVVVFLVAFVFCLVRRRGRGTEQNEEGARSVRRRDSSVNPVVSSPVPVSPVADAEPKDRVVVIGEFTYEQLLDATGRFSDGNLLKHGHSGDIYLGVLDNGSHVAVKKANAKSLKDMGELGFFANYSHERIVPLLGHLAKDEEELLVYKYMPKGDLTNALHKKPVDSEDGLPSLDWITRLKIAIGVAEALCFLHDECSPPLVHRDIQASSVVLDDKFEVRLGSLSEICAQQNGGSQNIFSRMLRSSKSLDKNTSGPPATCTYDVYCFGKVLLELVTGNFGVSGSNDAALEEWLVNTLAHINAYNKESMANIIDPLLVVDEDHLEEVWAVAIIAKTCLNSKPSRRPQARYVLKALENPVKVVRQDFRANSAQLRSTSSRSSWRSAFAGNREESSEIMTASGHILDRRHSAKSQGSAGESSFSFKRASPQIAPEQFRLEGNVAV